MSDLLLAQNRKSKTDTRILKNLKYMSVRCSQCSFNSERFKCQTCIAKDISELQLQISNVTEINSQTSSNLESKIVKITASYPTSPTHSPSLSSTIKLPNKTQRIILAGNEPCQIEKLSIEIQHTLVKIRKAQSILKRELLYIFNIKIQSWENSVCKLLVNNLVFNPYDSNMPIEVYNHNLTSVIHFVILVAWYQQVFLPKTLDLSSVIRVMKQRDEEFINLLASLNFNLNILVQKNLSKRESIDTNLLMCLLIQDSNIEETPNIEFTEILGMTRFMYYNSFKTVDFNECIETASNFEDEWEILS